MKHLIITTAIFLFTGIFCFAEANFLLPAEQSPIDNLDTVYFDLSQATISGDTLSFPVFINSDDVVNSVDFEMKFDLAKLTYNSVEKDLSTLDSPVANYNTNDSTLRLTAFSLNQIPNDVNLVTVKFDIIGNQIAASDFNSLAVLLNGSACSYKVIDATTPIDTTDTTTVGIFDNNTGSEVEISVFPNPANNYLQISVAENAEVQLFDIHGREATEPVNVFARQIQRVNVNHLKPGNYLLKVSGEGFMSIKRISILR